ncbi:uncharacterized protein Dana_GF23495 [Drosophila ananassae]|uniref:SAC domain-containing protein n=1 Tax=Drosophila ananassae TaxID=7217 RepID=B3MAJ8_DROAN|nr:phosphatidylinositide phosphatase SAC2-like [Drosophila ananassae]EDV41285.2 uncharacterized protein Dana_GF23495 [Drosophila ananassae]
MFLRTSLRSNQSTPTHSALNKNNASSSGGTTSSTSTKLFKGRNKTSSVPIYWSQPGYKYRPPPRLDRGSVETQQAFEKHFTKELNIYSRVCIVNLVEQSGKEKLIGDAYADHVIKYNNEKTFDFHDYCRGIRVEERSLQRMRLFWH